MNFQEQLTVWQKSNPKPETPPVHRVFTPRKPDPVVNGVPREPIDKTAAIVISKAPWWALPPQPTPKFHKPKTNNTNMQHDTPTKTITNNPMLAGRIVDKPKAQFDREIVDKSTKVFEKSVENAESFVERAKASQDAIEYMANHMRAAWVDTTDYLEKAIVELRQSKIALETEARGLLSALKDIRQFFFDEKHPEQIARLRDFVDLCERLQKLKESGFLDSVADTILKLTP